MKRIVGILLCTLLFVPVEAKIKTEFGDSTKTHMFTLQANMFNRGEYIKGALPNEKESHAAFVAERTRLTFNYKQDYLEIQISPQHYGVWGTTKGGAFSLYEAWGQTGYKGFFAKLGRQAISYDDERVIGSDDWSLTASTHDALKLGYEGFGHKIHVLGMYNKTDDNTKGGSQYRNGSQVYKNMEMAWYHYDFKRWFSGSLLFVNSGLQSELPATPDTTFYQQMAGTYWQFLYTGNQLEKDKAPWWVNIEASFYYQFGKTEYNTPIGAWMAAAEFNAKACEYLKVNTGYFHLSGDKNYTVPPPGAMGLQQHTEDHSFNLLYASHHQFYGAMDFFYLQSFYGGYSPGFQDWHIGATFTWKDQFDFEAKYHNMATSVKVKSAPSKMLGHELELTATYKPFDWLNIEAGYTFMQGTKTMEIVKRASDRNQSHWVYLMVTFKPTFLKVRF